MSGTLDLPEDQLALVCDMLRRHLPGRKIVAFGSRTNGRARPFSDLDLCVMGDTPVEEESLFALREALEDSPLPIKVDLIVWASVQPEFRKIIDAQPLIWL